MKKLWMLLVASLIICGFSGCQKQNDDNNENGSSSEVKVTTYDPQNITETSAVCGGDAIVLQQGLALSKLGVCWSISENPTIEDSYLVTEEWNEPFVCNLRELQPNTTYHIRAFVLRGLIVYYGEDKSFTTLGLPVVKTFDVDEVFQTSVICGGEVISEGTDYVNERGICWNTLGNPTINDEHIDSGSGVGSYNIEVTGLSGGVTYYARAYAINSVGVGYGEEVSFKIINSEYLSSIVNQFFNYTISPTYINLAEQTQLLVDRLVELKDNPMQSKVDEAAVVFLEVHRWWELSEAFLYGAATDFGIVSQIDTWPFDENAFNSLMSSPNMVSILENDEDGTIAGDLLSNTLLGFQGLEFVLFQNGQPRSVGDISGDMMSYMLAIARNLRNRCFQLEVSWLGSTAPSFHCALVEYLGLNTTVVGGQLNYGDNFLEAGSAGSTYLTIDDALVDLIDGCVVIADEVGTSKIGKCHTGEDVSYVESPYSQRSIVNFYNNILSVKYSYLGSIQGQIDNRSLHKLVNSVDASLDLEIMNAIEDVLNSINNMRAPFAIYYADSSAGEAMEACQHLSSVLVRVKSLVLSKL